jgi:propanol-preferring alcohol dehydrogenase
LLEPVPENNITVKTNPFDGIKEVPKAVELAHSGKMQGKPIILIDQEAIGEQTKSGLTMGEHGNQVTDGDQGRNIKMLNEKIMRFGCTRKRWTILC